MKIPRIWILSAILAILAIILVYVATAPDVNTTTRTSANPRPTQAWRVETLGELVAKDTASKPTSVSTQSSQSKNLNSPNIRVAPAPSNLKMKQPLERDASPSTDITQTVQSSKPKATPAVEPSTKPKNVTSTNARTLATAPKQTSKPTSVRHPHHVVDTNPLDVIDQFDLNTTTIRAGRVATLCAGVDGNAEASITGIGNLTGGTVTCYHVSPTKTTTYRLTVKRGVSVGTRDVTLVVQPKKSGGKTTPPPSPVVETTTKSSE